MRATILIVALCLFMSVSAQTCGGTWTNEQKWTGWNFYDQFTFFTEPDQTHGHVNFKDRASATSAGLISVNDKGQIYMGVDYKNVQPQGRDAIRIHSIPTFTEGLVILDLDHMPGSICGLWPAFWTRSDITGEIDIIEGVNKKNQNQMTLHTDITKCQMGGARTQSGSAGGLNCDSTDTKWAGCAVMSNKQGSYGDSFNAAGGGAYVMERSKDAIKMWHFPKGQYPADLLSGTPNTCNFPTPDAHFPLLDNCPPVNFAAQRIIFDITFCGDWAGNDYAPCGGGMDTCNNFVSNNPAAFKDAYWLINSLRLFVRDPKANTTYTPAPSTPSSTTANTNTPSTNANTNSCSDMFNNLKCRTTAQDPSQIDSGKLGGTRAWLCNNYPQFCGAVNYGGQYSTCNAAEQMSYAMNEYYKTYASAQGASACDFGGLGKVISAPVQNPTPAPATSSSSSLTCQKSSTCDSKLCACGSACYAPDQYCCASGQLTQLVNCPKSNTPTSSTTSNVATPSSTTPNVAATPATSAAATSSCTNMYNALTCRTSTQDVSKLDTNKLGGSRSWLCNNYPQFCGAVNYGGQYSTCNAAEQMSYAMNEYYKVYGSAQGASACDFGGVGQVVTQTQQSPCTAMFSSLKCRTKSQDPTTLDTNKLGGSRAWLCNNYSQFCGAVNYGGQYSTCNAAEQMSYAMNEYYKVYGGAQGASACDFGGVGQLQA